MLTHGNSWQKCVVLVLTSTGFFEIESDSDLSTPQAVKYTTVKMADVAQIAMAKTSEDGGFILTIKLEDGSKDYALDTPFYLRPDESERCTGDMVRGFEAVRQMCQGARS